MKTIAELCATQQWRPQDMAILVRDHSKALRLENALEAHNIPAIRQRNLGFFEHPVIQQAVALLTLVQDPQNDFAWINLLQRKLTHHELFILAQGRQCLKIAMAQESASYSETIQAFQNQPETIPVALRHALPLLMALNLMIANLIQQKASIPLENLIESIFEALPLVSDTEAETRWGQKALNQLGLFQKMLRVWIEQARQPLSLDGLMVLVSRMQLKNDLVLPMDEETLQEDAVRILTVHGAKGLEFPIVFLAGVDRFQKSRPEGLLTVDPQYPGKPGFGLFLNRFQTEKTLKKLVYDTIWRLPRTMEEELRLFYVAVTRAKTHLYISCWEHSFPYMNPRFFEDYCEDSANSDQ